jgi:hypothetical protein
MSAFKQFLSTDVIVSPLVVNKSFSFEGSASLNNVGCLILAATNGYNILSPIFFTSASIPGFNSSSITWGPLYNSIKQLYYTNYISNPISGSPYITNYLGQVIEDSSLTDVYSRFYNYEQTSLFQTNSYNYSSNYGYERYFSPIGTATVLSIPKNMFGDYINPNTFYFKIADPAGDYFGFEEYEDNGEGILTVISSSYTSPGKTAGIINYSHGTIIWTNSSISPLTVDGMLWIGETNNITCSFQSSRTIFETQYKCTIRPEEFNFSLNPSLISGSSEGTVYNFVTSSYFSPYVTTVGFYNENQELLMVAKLGQPLPTSATTDTTILVNIDK